MPTLRLVDHTPSWHLPVPADPSRWERLEGEKPQCIEVEYTAEEFAWVLACCPQVPLVVAVRALELGEREGMCTKYSVIK